MPYDAGGKGQSKKKRNSRYRIAAVVLLGAVVAFVYPIISAYYGVPPLYNHVISANLLAKYYLGSKTVKLPGAYFRFTSKYIHDGDEELVFDTVVACSTQVSSSRATGSSVLSGMTPNLFAKRTRNNNAVLVVTPDLCSEANRGLWDDLPETLHSDHRVVRERRGVHLRPRLCLGGRLRKPEKPSEVRQRQGGSCHACGVGGLVGAGLKTWCGKT